MRFRVGMIGLGKLGLPCAEVFARHHDVTGYDLAPRTSNSIRIASTLQAAVTGQDIVFVAVPTPHDPAYGGDSPTAHLPPRDFDYSAVTSAITDINRHASAGQLVVLISTVLPGTIRRQVAPLLSKAQLIYNPYLIAMGSIEWDVINPEMVIVGTEDGALNGTAARLRSFYQTFVQCDRYAVGTFEEAECIKIFYNTFISMKIGFANMVQDVAERNGHIDADIVCNALKMADQRITGPRYLTPGMGDGGPCHPRDNIALRSLADRLQLGYDMFGTLMSSREQQAQHLARLLMDLSQDRRLPIVIFGKTYKPGVPYTDGSYSLLIASYISNAGADVSFADPGTGDQPDSPGPWVVLLAHDAAVSYAAAASESTSLYRPIPPGSVVVDPWRKYPGAAGVEVIHYGNTRDRSEALSG
jgi:UDPglucose 6-dehydrogenase